VTEQVYTHTYTHYLKDWLVYLDYSNIFTKINNYKHASPHCREPVLRVNCPFVISHYLSCATSNSVASIYKEYH